MSHFWPLHLPAARLRLITAVGLGGLAAIGLAYWLTIGPAPGIRVRWQESVGAERQAALEQKYLLANRQGPMEGAPQSFAYDLLDTGRLNIWRLVTDPDVADTNDIDREAYRVKPNTRPGERSTWLANQIPGLRSRPVLLAVIVLLAAMGVTGLVGLARERRRLLSLGLLQPDPDHGDIFDRLSSRMRSLPHVGGDAPPLRWVRVVAAILVVVAIGLPIVETWESLLLAVAVLALLFGVGRPEPRRLTAAVGIALAVISVKAILPRADMAEAHNAFLVLNEGEALQRGLPPEVFRSWKTQFDTLYPPPVPPYAYASWRYSMAIPRALFSRSGDAIWRPATYSRQVDAIDFDTLATFRGGFANDPVHNFWAGDVGRERLPFYAMYELTAAAAGSQLEWKGQVFWERAGGGFDELLHPQPAARVITSEDAGKKVYALFLLGDENLRFRMIPSWPLRIATWARTLLTLFGVSATLWLIVHPRWPDFFRAVVVSAVAYRLILLTMSLSGKWFLGYWYSPHGGGDDGLAHEGFGQAMALLAGDGRIIEALKGGEAVYWFTPGMRYFRMVEKILFGDTNHLYALVLACLPLLVFYLMRHLVRLRWAWVFTVLFCLMPVGNLSFLNYVTNARIGYAEALGGELFLLGLVLLLRTQPAWGGDVRNGPLLWSAGAALAAAMFVRPNFALSVVWVGAAWTWASWRRRDLAGIVALGSGLALALWMPFHNWYYGGEFFLISRSGSSVSVPVSVADYVTAARDTLQGRSDTAAVTLAWNQLSGWFAGPAFADLYSGALRPLAWGAHGLRLIALAVTCWVALVWIVRLGRTNTTIAVIAIAAIGAQIPMFFVHATFDRYAMLGWDLSLVVLIAWLARHFGPGPGLLAERLGRAQA